MASEEFGPPVTVGFLRSFLSLNSAGNDLVLTDGAGVPFRLVAVVDFNTPNGPETVVSLRTESAVAEEE